MKLNDTIEVLERLTKSEKRALSVAVKRSSKSEEPSEQHFRLYQLLSAMLKEAERLSTGARPAFIEKHLEESKTRHPKLFTSLNVIRLYDFIFDALRSLHADKAGFKPYKYLQDLQVLRDKRLGHQAIALLEKAKKEAREGESFMSDLHTLQLLMVERRALLTLVRSRDFNRLSELRQACRLQLRRTQAVLDTMDDQEVIQFYSTKGRIPDEAIEEASPVFKQLLHVPGAKQDLPFDAALRGLFATSLYLKRDRFSYPEDFKKMFTQVGHMIDLFKGNETRKTQNRQQYLLSLLALANSCIETGQRQPFEEHLDEFKQALGLDPSQPMQQEAANIIIDKKTSRNDYTLIYLLTAYYVGIGEWGTALAIIEHIKEALESFKPPTEHLMVLYFLMASAYFLTGDYGSAEPYINKLQDEDITTGHRLDLTYKARLLELLLIYERHGDGENRLLLERVGQMYTKLSTAPTEGQDPKVTQADIQGALLLLATLSAIFTNTGKQHRLDALKKLYSRLTEDMGDLITEVFALWARQKIERLSQPDR